MAYIKHWKIKKKSYKNNKFKISAPTPNEEFELPDGSCSVSVIQDYFTYISKIWKKKIDNPSIRTYINKTKSRITFEIKAGYYLEYLLPEMMKFIKTLKIR